MNIAVMVHGAFAGPWCFDGWRRRFVEAGWRVETPTLRHHEPGGDEAALAQTGIADYREDLAALIAGLPEKPVLIGHSLGGLLAQLLAARGLARAAVLLAPARPWGVPPTTQDEVNAALGLMSIGPFWTQALHPNWEIAAANSLQMLPEAERRAVFDRFGAESGRVLLQSMLWTLDLDRTTAVERIDVPVWAAAFGEDKVTASSSVRLVAAKYGAPCRTYDGRGHMGLLEADWEKICDDVLAWLGQTRAA
jgi:pimeloyl-ACP methyl ester carboxylesterase